MTSMQTNSLKLKNDLKMFNVPNVLYENRYCTQDDFSILICGGNTYEENKLKTLSDVYILEPPKLESSEFPSMLETRYWCETAVINSDIVVVGGRTNSGSYLHSIELFSSKNRIWCKKSDLLDNRLNFCVSSFKQNLFIIGGEIHRNNYVKYLRSCLVYNMKCDQWSLIADMNKERSGAACTVYEGKIVVSGACISKSVEGFDYYENKWTYLPNMIEERDFHASLSMGNKLFVVGGGYSSTFEVFDSYSSKFSCIHTSPYLIKNMGRFQAVCRNNQIIVFCKDRYKYQTKVFTYNNETSEWKPVECGILQNKYRISCTKYYH